MFIFEGVLSSTLCFYRYFMEPTLGYYNEAHNLAIRLDSLVKEISASDRFWAGMDEIIALNNKDQQLLKVAVALDCYKCYRKTGITPNVDEITSLPILLTVSLVVFSTDLSRSALKYARVAPATVQNFIDTNLPSLYETAEKLEDAKSTDFVLARALHKYDTQREKLYYRFMYKMSLLAIQLSPTVSQDQSHWLASVFELSI